MEHWCHYGGTNGTSVPLRPSHFVAWEQPELFSDTEIRASFRPVR
jgi:hypothetical protein